MQDTHFDETQSLFDAIDQAEQMAAQEDTDTAGAEATETLSSKEEKKGMFARLRCYMQNRKEVASKAALEKESGKTSPPKKKTVGGSVRTLSEVTAEDMNKFNDFLGAIETQLDKVEGQNENLLRQISTLDKNNQLLLEQVQTLTKNNNQLTEQYNNMKKREKLAKIMAIIAATFSIGLAVFNIIFNIILPNIG